MCLFYQCNFNGSNKVTTNIHNNINFVLIQSNNVKLYLTVENKTQKNILKSLFEIYNITM